VEVGDFFSRSPQTASNSRKFQGPTQKTKKVQNEDRLKLQAIATKSKPYPKKTQNRQNTQKPSCDKEPKTSKNKNICFIH
jgi:hypothetical protein